MFVPFFISVVAAVIGALAQGSAKEDPETNLSSDERTRRYDHGTWRARRDDTEAAEKRREDAAFNH
jgi:hypothetical protein